MSRNTFREQRRAARAAKIRNRRIALGLILLAVVAAAAFLVYRAISPPDQAEALPPAASEDTITTASGLQYQDVEVGTGQEAAPGDRVSVHYTGWLEDGAQFDSSRTRGQPFEFTLGAGNVIQGWDEGVVGMREGGKRTLIIPPDLGYGPEGFPGAIPPNAVLVFDVELLEVK